MTGVFDMNSLGLPHYCLGVEVWQIGSSIVVSHTKYDRSLLNGFKMIDCKISCTPMKKALNGENQD
jgi:hypothetical protein